ncbi:HAD-IIB family hydrolase [Flavihumibacter petaseus]|nr:HAD-IIB family hydrolase [Flavihumibacter petaseus]
MLLLATDLDGTLLGGNYEEKHELYSIISANPSVRLVFVTGRGLPSILPLLNDPFIPNPDYIIADVGATVVDGKTLLPVEPLHTEIMSRWPGEALVRERLKQVPHLREQVVPMDRRCSYYLHEQLDITEVKSIANGLGCDVIVSAGKFVDVLPGGINKGFTLRRLMEMLNVPEKEVLVAGDTLNDLSLFETGYKGVVVGGAEKELLDATSGHQHVYQAERLGCGGILQALHHYNAVFDGI